MDMTAALDAHVRRIVGLHFDERSGSPYWLKRGQELGIDAIRQVQSFADLARLGPMAERTLAERPLLDFVPLSRRSHLRGAILAETAGTTGRPQRTIFTVDEFHAAFVRPFVLMAERAGFPREAAWLYVGPGGPHVIGQAAAACAAAMGGPQPFAIDFDPRWFRKMPHDSLGRKRYIRHLLDQVGDVISTEPVEVLFTTPAMLEGLAGIMSDVQRERIRGVHYGGMRVAPDLLWAAQTQWFPKAVHLAGYGNSLFGVCMEEGGPPTRPLRYFPHGLRLQIRVAGDGGVRMYRLDETILIVDLPERDAGTSVAAPPHLQGSGFTQGVEDPGPRTDDAERVPMGIY